MQKVLTGLLEETEKIEQEIKTILSEITENFQNLWNRGNYVQHLHERPKD